MTAMPPDMPPDMPPAMVFAAGYGTRMGALTRDQPKPLLPVAGRSLIDRTLDLAAEAGITRAVVNLHYRAAMLRDHLAARRTPALAFSDETEAILETGGGLKAALPLLGPGPVVTLNADAVFSGPNPVATLLAGGLPAGGAARLLLVPRGAATGHAGPGDFFLDDGGTLRRRGTAAEAPYVFTGAQVIDPEAVAAWPARAFSLNPVWDALIAAGRLTGAVHAGGWADVGTPQGLALAAALLA